MLPDTRRLLTAEQIEIVRAGAAAGRRRDDIAAAIGVTPYILTKRMRDQLDGLKLPRGRKRGGLQEWPSPEEVELRKIEVRAKWSRARWGLDGKKFSPKRTGRSAVPCGLTIADE